MASIKSKVFDELYTLPKESRTSKHLSKIAWRHWNYVGEDGKHYSIYNSQTHAYSCIRKLMTKYYKLSYVTRERLPPDTTKMARGLSIKYRYCYTLKPRIRELIEKYGSYKEAEIEMVKVRAWLVS